MFDSLVYIPAIMAYSFVALLIVILGFIVIYVSHKIYATIYDNLPVAQLSSSSLAIGQQLKKSMGGGGITKGKIMGRKSKTALRIIVTLEPCYLAYVLFKTDCAKSKISEILSLDSAYLQAADEATSAAASQAPPRASVSLAGGTFGHHNILVKYYDDLAAIPTSRHFMHYDDDNIPNTKSKMQQ